MASLIPGFKDTVIDARADFNQSAYPKPSADSKFDTYLKEYLADFYLKDKLTYIEEFLEQHDLKITQAVFEILKDKKKDGLRKDGVTPDLAHEIDQLYSKISSLDKGVL